MNFRGVNSRFAASFCLAAQTISTLILRPSWNMKLLEFLGPHFVFLIIRL